MHDGIATSWPYHLFNIVRVGIMLEFQTIKSSRPWNGQAPRYPCSSAGKDGTCVNTNRGKGNNLKIKDLSNTNEIVPRMNFVRYHFNTIDNVAADTVGVDKKSRKNEKIKSCFGAGSYDAPARELPCTHCFCRTDISNPFASSETIELFQKIIVVWYCEFLSLGNCVEPCKLTRPWVR